MVRSIGSKPSRCPSRLLRLLGEQARARQHGERQRHLRDDEPSPRHERSLMHAASDARERVERRDPRHRPCRRHREEHAGHDRQRDGKEQHRRRRRCRDRHERRSGEGERDHRARADQRDQHSGSAAGQGEQDAFDHRLPHEAPGRGAERGANRRLTAIGSGEQQVREVGAGDEQQDRRGEEQHRQRARELPLHQRHAATGRRDARSAGAEAARRSSLVSDDWPPSHCCSAIVMRVPTACGCAPGEAGRSRTASADRPGS